MKKCEFCEKTMKPQNFKKHFEVCLIRREFNLSKSKILEAIGGKPVENTNDDLQIMNDKLMLEKNKMIDILRRFSDEAKSLLLNEDNEFNSLARISEMSLSESTKLEYQGEWKAYQKWCFKQKVSPMIPQSAERYLAQLPSQVSTIKSKKNRLQSILRFLTGSSIIIRGTRRRIRHMPKYKMSQEEVEKYLAEQNEISHEDFIVQSIMARYGCRISACSGLRLRHLEFLKRGGNVMFLPECKSNLREVEADKPLRKLLSRFVRDKEMEDDDFIFNAGPSSHLKRRANYLCARINKRIKDSKVLVKSPNYKYSTHMFRHTRAFKEYRKCLEMAKDAARRAIGHAENSSSIEYYLRAGPGY
jgi:integrase